MSFLDKKDSRIYYIVYSIFIQIWALDICVRYEKISMILFVISIILMNMGMYFYFKKIR